MPGSGQGCPLSSQPSTQYRRCHKVHISPKQDSHLRVQSEASLPRIDQCLLTDQLTLLLMAASMSVRHLITKEAHKDTGSSATAQRLQVSFPDPCIGIPLPWGLKSPTNSRQGSPLLYIYIYIYMCHAPVCVCSLLGGLVSGSSQRSGLVDTVGLPMGLPSLSASSILPLTLPWGFLTSF